MRSPINTTRNYKNILTYTYISKRKFDLVENPKSTIQHERGVIVTVVALYGKAQTLPLPDMYGKNLTFNTGGVDGCDCEETLKLIAEGKLDTETLITHTYPLSKIDEAYELFETKRDGVIKVAVEC